MAVGIVERDRYVFPFGLFHAAGPLGSLPRRRRRRRRRLTRYALFTLLVLNLRGEGDARVRQLVHHHEMLRMVLHHFVEVRLVQTKEFARARRHDGGDALRATKKGYLTEEGAVRKVTDLQKGYTV